MNHMCWLTICCDTWQAQYKEQSGTNTKERLDFHTSVATQKPGKCWCCALGLNALRLAHLRCWCLHAVPQVSSRRGWCLSNGEWRERERGIRGGCQTELETRGGKMMGYIFALEFRWGGESFLEAHMNREVCRPPAVQPTAGVLYAVFLFSFLLSTSLPACPACVHGHDQKWQWKLFWCAHTHISCRYAYLHKLDVILHISHVYFLTCCGLPLHREFLGVCDGASGCIYTLDLVNEKSPPIATIIEFVPYLSSALMRC